MKPQITYESDGVTITSPEASKELRHEAADHDVPARSILQTGDLLQKSCGMKPQITIASSMSSASCESLQKSCGMKPQIT